MSTKALYNELHKKIIESGHSVAALCRLTGSSTTTFWRCKAGTQLSTIELHESFLQGFQELQNKSPNRKRKKVNNEPTQQAE